MQKYLRYWILLLLGPVFFYGLAWPELVVSQIDHCSIAMCDFVRHYAPQSHMIRAGESTIVGGWFYPPLLAILLVPLTYLSDPSLGWFWINSVGLLGMCWCCVRYARTQWWIALIVCVQSLPILHSMKWGQVSILLSLFVILGIFANKRYRPFIFAFLGSIKLYPMILFLPTLLRKEGRNLVMGGIVFLFFSFLIPIICIGWDFTFIMWDHVFVGARRVRSFATFGGGQSLFPVLERLFHDGAHTQRPMDTGGLLWTIPLWCIEVLYTLIVCTLVLWTRRAYVSTQDQHLRYMLIWVFLHLVLSPGWHHYMAFVPFVLLWCRDKKKGRIFSGVGLFLILTPVFFLGSMEGVYVTYSSWGGTFGALLCTWLSLIQIAMSSFSLAEIDQEDTNKSHRGGTREQIII